jgi:hypothetical protein
VDPPDAYVLEIHALNILARVRACLAGIDLVLIRRGGSPRCLRTRIRALNILAGIRACLAGIDLVLRRRGG